MTYCATVRAFSQTMALSARQKVLQKHVQLTNFPINQSVSTGSSNASVGNNESANMQNPYLMHGHLPRCATRRS
ncbi:hypothetical protein, partial [Bifidobacterium breve]|uniref:hypothetical protein n=1 Tax=Bifidobacterium breve TaxID=1685 RepID=UPI00216482D2